MERLEKFKIYRNTSILAGKILNDFVIAEGLKLKNANGFELDYKLVGHLGQYAEYSISLKNLNDESAFLGSIANSLNRKSEEDVPVDFKNIDKDLLLQILKVSSLEYNKVEFSPDGFLVLSK